MQPPRFGTPDCVAFDSPQLLSERRAVGRRYRPVKVSHTHARRTREGNVWKYRRLLNTQLTDLERNSSSDGVSKNCVIENPLLSRF